MDKAPGRSVGQKRFAHAGEPFEIRGVLRSPRHADIPWAELNRARGISEVRSSISESSASFVEWPPRFDSAATRDHA